MSSPTATRVENQFPVGGERVPAELWRALIDNLPVAVFVGTTSTGHVLEANPAAQTLWGMSEVELRKHTGRSLHLPEDGHLIDQISGDLDRDGFSPARRIRARRKDGTVRWCELQVTRLGRSSPSTYLTVARDISDQMQAEGARHEFLERMSTVAQLTSGVVAEVESPLTRSLSCLELAERIMQEQLTERSPRMELLELVRDGRQQLQLIHRLSRDLRAYAESDASSPSLVCLDQVARDAARLMEPQLPRGIRLSLDLAGLPTTQADGPRLTQLLVQLLLNARDAVWPQGNIVLRTLHEGDQQVLVVEDDGPGLSTEAMAHLFEPFSPARPSHRTGGGTGLGLAVAARIAHRHNGKIWAENRPQRGARIRVQIPLVAVEPTQEISRGIESPVVEGRVLVVDDEPAILRAISRSLRGRYEVVTAPGGLEALEALRTQTFDLILLDYRMPGMDGQQVYRALSEVDQAKVMFVTAGAYSPEGTIFLAKHPVLSKPFTPRELREAVEERLRFLQPDRASMAATR